MNAKKKNKKANKPSNLNPPQNVEKVSQLDENIEKSPKCEVKEEKISKPEIASEVAGTTVLVSDAKETESEMPKKPKRNKGKKKTQDKDEEINENVQEKSQEGQIEHSVKVQEPETLTVTGENENKKNILDQTSIVPSARKKKNKKKGQEKETEAAEIPDEVSAPGTKNQPVEVLEKIDTEIKELFSSNLEIPKQDAKKKKNKKKNRNDSEKSDKSENAVSCTSGFQKLLVEDEIPTEKTQEIPTNLLLEKDTFHKAPPQIRPSVETINNEKAECQNDKGVSKDENKTKKKNKKDKKQVQKETTDVTKAVTLHEVSVILDDVATKEVPSNDEKYVTETVEMPIGTKQEKELSPKPKAKIAKPVEKKRKEKQDTQSSDNLSKTESSEILEVDKTEPGLPKETDIELKDIPTFEIIETQGTEQTPAEETDIPTTVENINVPSESAMGKKRKKSPKPSKNKEAHKDITYIELPQQQQSETLSEVTESAKTIVSDLTQPKINIASSKLKEVPTNVSKELHEDMIKPKEDQQTDTLKTKSIDRSLTPESKVDEEGFETKTNKKKKKIPKILQDVTHEKQQPVIKKSADNQDKPIQNIEEKIDFPQELSFSVDLEVRSLKTDESEASSCDAIPDVLFVRSSSQQFLDNNNNTIIQELIQVEEIKLSDPLFIPLIEGSGETPTHTPELVTSGIRITEFEAKSPTEEKTDIKSKIMEVNQDMEELRLSIERSLAEFTALENCEKEAETKPVTETIFKNQKSPLKDNKHKTLKKEEHIIKQDISDKMDANELENPSPVLSLEGLKPIETSPVCPARKDNKSKGKSKKKGKQELTQATSVTPSTSTVTHSTSKDDKKEEKTEQKSEQKSESAQEKGKQQSTLAFENDFSDTSKYINSVSEPVNSELMPDTTEQKEFEPIEQFEDALTSSVDDVNKTFEIIAKEVDDDNVESQKKLAANKPEINITEPTEETNTTKNEKVNPVSQPKNLLGQIDIPVQSNRTDYKKEKNKTPNARQAKVKIKDSMDIEKKQSKESQTDIKRARKNSDKSVKESFSKVKNDNEEYVYKYSFRKVFLQSSCHICNKELGQVRIPCGYCSLVFYCGVKHKDEDWPQHQALCFAVSTLSHMKDQKHIYADAQNTTGQDYRLLRMQMIVSCEKVLKRRLVPWEQEAMLYPRICADVACREWRQGKLKDCDGCGQLSYCAAHPSHFPKSHSRWCKSYSLYQKLVSYQQTKGRLEPRLPTKLMSSEMPTKMNEVLASMYEEKIDMNDIQYAALTQLATAPMTTAYCLQLYRKVAATTSIPNGVHKKQPFTIHVVGAELQFEADALNKWETFFLHLRPDVEELKVVLVSAMLNPGNLPLDLLAKIKCYMLRCNIAKSTDFKNFLCWPYIVMQEAFSSVKHSYRLCDSCQQNKRRVIFKFEDNKNYHEYRISDDFINPDIICAFNPSIQRSSIYNGKDPWPATINCILKLKQPFIVTSYTLIELRKDVARIKQVADIDVKLVLEPGFNNFASVRPDRNFISDDEMPLLFKNYCVAVVLGC